VKEEGIKRIKIPSERTPQVLLCKDRREVNNAEAVTLCNGVNEICVPANCTGNLKCNHIINQYIFIYSELKNE